MTANLYSPIPETTRILVVDDDPGLLLLVSKQLERLGPTPTTVETGTGAISLLQDGPFNLLILDLMLPDMDGLQILATIRNDPRFDEMPVLILSARVDDESIEKGLNLGADGYITKPYISHTLTKHVKKLINFGRAVS